MYLEFSIRINQRQSNLPITLTILIRIESQTIHPDNSIFRGYIYLILIIQCLLLQFINRWRHIFTLNFSSNIVVNIIDIRFQ